MSFILDALKKSDAERRLGSAPTLGDQAASAAADLTTELGPLTLILSSVLAVALLVTGWVWFQAPEAGRVPVSTEQPIAQLPEDSSAPAAEPVAEPVAEIPQRPTADTGTRSQATAQPSDDASGSDQPSRELAAVRAFQAADDAGENDSSAEAAQEEAPEPRPVGTGVAVNNTPAEADTQQPSEPAVSQPEPRPVAEAQVPTQLDSPRPRPQNEPAGSGTAEPARPEPVHRYELPANIRNQLPEFNVAVQVYDNDPAARFAIINGQRLREGDALQGGLVLKQVRRNDLVFTFRRYEFKVTP